MLAGGIAALVGAGLVLKGGQWRQQRVLQSYCISNLKQIGLGIAQYSRDYDEMMPLASNWSTALWPYTRSPPMFQCPQRGAAPQGYALHKRAAGAHSGMFMFQNRAKMVLLFDSDGAGINTADTGTSLPTHPRHPQGFGIAFSDGQVKMMTRPDFKFGYGSEFQRADVRARAERAKFWAEYQRKERVTKQQNADWLKRAKKP